MKKHGVKGFFASPFFLIFANKKNMEKNPDLFLKIMVTKLFHFFLKFTALWSQVGKIGVF
jgi:hypothetical protein